MRVHSRTVSVQLSQFYQVDPDRTCCPLQRTPRIGGKNLSILHVMSNVSPFVLVIFLKTVPKLETTRGTQRTRETSPHSV